MAIAVKQTPKQTIHHKRRSGHHQKRNEHFVKTYWPYLPIAAIVGLGMLFNGLLMHPGVLSYATNTSSDGLLASTNSERIANGLGALAINNSLSEAAQAKANDMVSRNYWSHNTPDGKEPWTFIIAAGYSYEAAGENLAYGFSDSGTTVTGWMNSAGHRANILNGTYTEVGFGIANSGSYQEAGEQTIVVAMYAKPVNKFVQQEATTTDETADAVATTPTTAASTAGAQQQSDTVSVSATVKGETKVARIQVATSGGAPWSLVAVSFIGVLLLLAFVTRHSIAWHRALVKGEKFVLKHKVLDILIVSGIMIGFILSRTVGIIQ